MEKIYVDNAATTAVCDEAVEAMIHHFKVNYGNPSSVHAIGQAAAKSLKSARDTIAGCIGAQSNEIFFTSGGTEADNWAIKFAAFEGAKKGKKHIITSKFEHHAVLHTLETLKKDGFEIAYLDVYSNGTVKPQDVKNTIRSDTALVTIMYANNEIGTIQPIAEIGKICRESGVLFHTDAVQAVGHVPIDVNEQYIDLLSMASHKFHGPKGIGALYCRKGLQLNSLFYGGAQESGKRAGTENVAGAVGMATALKKACDEMEESNKKIIYLRDKLIDELLKIPYARLNGDAASRLPGNVNLSFEGVEGESLLLSLDMYGICASSGSACTSGSLDPSHVLLAIGLTHEVAHGSLRLTLSPYNTEEEIDFIIKTLPPVIERLRDMSPVWERMMKGDK